MFESLRSDQLSPLYLQGFFLFRVERLNSNSDFYSDFTSERGDKSGDQRGLSFPLTGILLG